MTKYHKWTTQELHHIMNSPETVYYLASKYHVTTGAIYQARTDERKRRAKTLNQKAA